MDLGFDCLSDAGHFAADLLDTEIGPDSAPFTDLRPTVSRLLRKRAGGLEEAAALLDPTTPPAWTNGRGGRRIAALASVLGAIRTHDDSA